MRHLVLAVLVTALTRATSGCIADIDVDDDHPDGSETPVLVTLFAHNEEDGYYPQLLEQPDLYADYRADLVARVELIDDAGATLNWGSDHTVLRAMARWEPTMDLQRTGGSNVLRWMSEDMHVSIDPHGHLTTYNLADLAALIADLGVNPSTVVSGFELLSCGQDEGQLQYTDWEQVLAIQDDGSIVGQQFPQARWTPGVLAQPAMIGHMLDEFSSGVWRPGPGEEFTVHHPEASLVTIGQGYPHDRLNLGDTNSGGTAVLSEGGEYIAELVQLLDDGSLPADGIYTASIQLRDAPSIPGVDSSIEGLAATLEALAPLVESGRVIYLDYEAVLARWLADQGGQPTRVGIEEFSFYDPLWDSFIEACWGTNG